jgi:hypothetical protein
MKEVLPAPGPARGVRYRRLSVARNFDSWPGSESEIIFIPLLALLPPRRSALPREQFRPSGRSALWQAVRPADLWVHGLDHDPTRLNRIMISSLCLSMISAQTRSAFVARENRFPPFRIMLQRGSSATSDEQRPAGNSCTLLFDQLQRRAPPLVLRRFRIFRCIRGIVIRHHRIAQRPQILIRDLIEFHPKLKNCHRQQLRRLPVSAVGENRPALLEGRKDRMQSFFRTSHQRFVRHRACEVQSRQSNRSFHTPLHKVRISSKRLGEFRPPARPRAHDWPTHRINK